MTIASATTPAAGHDADVAPLVVRLVDRLAGDQVGRRQRAGQRRDRLDRAADDERLAVGDAAGQPAGVVRAVDPAAVLVAALDDVVDGRPEPPRLLEAEPELDALDDVDAHDRRGQRGVEPPVPVDVRAEPDRAGRGRRPRRRRRPCRRPSAPRRSGRSSRPRRPGPGSAAARRRPRRAIGVQFAGSTATPPTSAVNDQASMPSSRRKARATPPAATRAAVSRAEARSRTLRTSLKPYLRAPARSAWPGRTRVTGVARLLPSSAASWSAAGRLVVERLDRP